MVDPSYIGFYAAIAPADLSDVELIVRGYTNQYLIACECSPSSHKATSGWHMHFLIASSEKAYRNLIQNLKLKYNLTGKTTKDNAHGYGRVRGELRDTEKYISYMLKDQENIEDVTWPTLFRFGHFALDYLIALQAKSYPKSKPTDIRDEIMHFIGETMLPTCEMSDAVSTSSLLINTSHPVTIARERIVRYYQENTDKAPSRSRVQQLLLHYFVQYNKLAMSHSQICEWFYA